MNEKRCCQSEVAAIFLGLWCLFVGPAAEVRAEAGELAAARKVATQDQKRCPGRGPLNGLIRALLRAF